MRVLAIGDIGVVDGMMHIGDEAMFESFVEQARIRGVTEIVGISSNPPDTAVRYGIQSISRLGLEGDRDTMLRRAEQILAGDLGVDDPARTVIDEVHRASRVVITGAGNLASNWPVHIIERWSIAKLAQRAGVPLVISGQTLGPNLNPEDSELLAELLQIAELVGVREAPSFAVASRLGVDPEELQQTVDDASYLAFAPERQLDLDLDIDHAAPEPASAPYCLVSLSTHVGSTDRDQFIAAVAALLDDIAGLGYEVVFHAHFGAISGNGHRGDVVIHEDVRSRMASPSRRAPTGTSMESVGLAKAAALVVSSRYHPAVFASASGVPVVGIAVDDYTDVKLRGALGAFGQDTVITGEELVAGEGAGVVGTALAAREQTKHAASRIAGELLRSGTWWDRVVGRRA